MSQWYAVRTATRREFTAMGGLIDAGYAVFMPMQREWRILTRARRKEAVDRPLIPNILFVLCDGTDEALAEVGAIEGVSSFVRWLCDDGELRPIAIPLREVLDLQARERAGEFDTTRRVRVKYQPRLGERVKVQTGVWQGFLGKVVATPRGERTHVMIEGPGGRGVVLEASALRRA